MRIQPTGVHFLPNGMRVLTRELRHAPLASVMCWYGVGSRNERTGQTGISHFLEHMMFKGTPRFPYGALETAVKRRGGMWNAFTSYDYTAYYEVLPSRFLEFGLEVEADRMANMTFDPDLTVRERGIIVAEREGSENSPQTWLFEAFMQEAYREFPYRHMVLGHKDDIKATTAETLTAHYARYYRPNNATLVVAGDFETGALLELAHRHFGAFPRGADVEPLPVSEPEQQGERRLEVRRPGPNPHLLAGYKIPGADHPDQAALTMLAAVLAGPPSFGRGGGGMGRSSRLYRNLVNRGVATGAGGHPWSLQYPGLFICSAMPVPGVAPDRLEAELFAQLEALRQDRVPADELERAQKQVRAQFLTGLETATNQARLLGATAMTQSVESFDHALEELEAVTAEDMLRVAQAYLAPERRTVGWFLPEQAGAAPVNPAPVAPPPGELGTTPDFQRPGGPEPEAPKAGQPARILDPGLIVRRELPGGAALLMYPAAGIPSVLVRVQVEAGPVQDPAGKAGRAVFAVQMATRGSTAFTAEELALKTDALGISISADTGRETAVYALKCLPEDLETGLSLLAEVIRHPVFPEDELERMRERLLVGVRHADNDTRSVAARRLAEQLYPEGHPYRSPSAGTEESLRGITRADLAQFHAEHIGPAGAVITVVGDFAPDRMEQALRAAFDGWAGGAGRMAVPAAVACSVKPVHATVAGKTQTDVALGWPLVDRSHPDYLALECLATLFGGNGTPATSRLFRDVRERFGLSYYQFASFGSGSGPSPWTVHIGVNPAKVEFALQVLTQELQRLREEPAGDLELGSLKDFLESYPAVQHESPERVAARLAEMERYGLGLDFVERYPALVRALTAAQLQEAAVRHLDPRCMAVVTAGPERE